MHIGIQIEAPEGWGQLPMGGVFHFLKSDAKRGRVLLVHFDRGTPTRQPKAQLLALERKKFEEGIALEKIIPTAEQSILPPWLKELEGIDLSQVDRERPNAKILHSSRVEDRFLNIAPSVCDFEGVMQSKDPEAELNRRARLCDPPQNETRFRVHFLTYMCFGRNMWVLLPPFHRIGHWDRYVHPDRKYGRPSLAFGRHYGNGSSKELTDRCVKAYLARAGLGKFLIEIYDDAMVYEFGCQRVVGESGMKLYVHPRGESFPTYWQFRYRVQQAIGIEEMQKTLYGAVRFRTRKAASLGPFSEEIANLMERMEADGYFTKERPKGYVEGSVLPPLCVVTGRDLLSGLKLGIGFSFGAEKHTAYRMMLFCMAVPKDYFGSLFGIKIDPQEWPNIGLPSNFGIDRGPGAKQDLIAEVEKRFPIKDMAPSYSGQSKATIETSNPRNMHAEGQPTYLASNLTPIQLAIKEILRLLKYNQADDMEGRFEPDSDLAFVPPSPIGLWSHYDRLFRNDAMPISIEDAVRLFLTPIEFSLHDDGVWLDQRRYFSTELEESGILDKVARSGKTGTKIQGYILDLCVRYIWVEVEGRLLQLEAMLRIRGDEETLWMSLAELEQWQEARRKTRSAFQVHQHAVGSEFVERFEDSTGQKWDSAVRRPGKPKRCATAKQEEAEARQVTSRRVA
ncbi:hypothetical protein [Sideroxydans lithotrophicus]|uniref:Putative Tn7-like transposition protein B n=1 Tax=Sideroxydans lithotrophicus (strain ES-1) TaxID=580332 RepID=D5CQU8_SIDLE|nr:hypothetical protein [Sideroxydans lithotrophicus]ADE11334.1 putative Tn7-like transposition protein B [Sideroxydans lithotrophicus ES-1]